MVFPESGETLSIRNGTGVNLGAGGAVSEGDLPVEQALSPFNGFIS